MLAPPQADPRLTPAPPGEDEDGGEPGLPGAAPPAHSPATIPAAPRTAPACTICTTMIPHLSYPIANSVNGTFYLTYRVEDSIL